MEPQLGPAGHLAAPEGASELLKELIDAQPGSSSISLCLPGPFCLFSFSSTDSNPSQSTFPEEESICFLSARSAASPPSLYGRVDVCPTVCVPGSVQ